jgi:hypothetical protein
MIQVVSEYANVRKLAPLPANCKNWTIKPKPQPIGIERQLKGHVTVRHGHSYLTDKVTSVTYDNPEEMLKGMHQATEKRLEAYRHPDQKDFVNSERQNVGGMWSSELVRRIRKINPKLFIQDSRNAPGCAAFYKMVGDELTYTNASFRHGFVPKYSIMKEDKAGLATEFTYGWTTVLLRLIKLGDLKYNAVVREFGYIDDDRAKHWAIYTKQYRA